MQMQRSINSLENFVESWRFEGGDWRFGKEGRLRLKIVDKYFYEIYCKIRKKCIFAKIGRMCDYFGSCDA
jgi:hypothetical protein